MADSNRRVAALWPRRPPSGVSAEALMAASSVPWWAKIAAKIVLSRLPLPYGFWQRIGLFRHGCMDNSGYARTVFDTHVERAGLAGKLRGKTVVELGPGDSVATAVV